MSPVVGQHGSTGYYAAHLYGAEYKTYHDAQLDKDPVCAVCRSSPAATVMIPGTNVCGAGWTKQYSGYLMAERHDHGSSQFLCMDSAMESRPGTDATQDGQLFYFTTLTCCGSLPCSPYQNDKVVTCVVCSK
jgi:hypothetical protein